jgi:hypothetical protein
MQIPISVPLAGLKNFICDTNYTNCHGISFGFEPTIESIGVKLLSVRFRLRFPVFQPIDPPWANNTGHEPNAGDEKPIWSARKRHFVRHPGSRPSRGKRRNPSWANNAVVAFTQEFGAEAYCQRIFSNAGARTLFNRRWAQHYFCLA